MLAGIRHSYWEAAAAAVTSPLRVKCSYAYAAASPAAFAIAASRYPRPVTKATLIPRVITPLPSTTTFRPHAGTAAVVDNRSSLLSVNRRPIS